MPKLGRVAEVEVNLHLFLLSTIDGCQESGLLPSSFIAGERAPCAWLGPRVDLHALEKRKKTS